MNSWKTSETREGPASFRHLQRLRRWERVACAPSLLLHASYGFALNTVHEVKQVLSAKKASSSNQLRIQSIYIYSLLSTSLEP